MADKKTDLEGLTAAAEALRRAARKGREDDRTTLEVDGGTERSAAQVDELGEALVARGLITRHQLFNALNESYKSGGTLEEALLALGMIDHETLERVRGQ